MPVARACAMGWVAAIAIAAGGAAWAATSPLLAMFDANDDGHVSLTEYQAYMDKGFQRMDANGDAILEAGEWPPGTQHEGTLTLAAHRRHVARQFHRQDANHDGTLDIRELMAPPR